MHIDAGTAMQTQADATTPVSKRGAAVRFPLPPLLFAAPMAASLALHHLVPWRIPGQPLTTAVGVGLTLAGVAFSLSGAATVLRHRTTLAPHRAVSALVTAGPFRISRNPMYAGHVVSVVGVALWAGSWWPLLAAFVGMLATLTLVIHPEEEYLAARFGADYARYRSRVRRWF